MCFQLFYIVFNFFAPKRVSLHCKEKILSSWAALLGTSFYKRNRLSKLGHFHSVSLHARQKYIYLA